MVRGLIQSYFLPRTRLKIIQIKDESECYHWAKEQTGFDPMSSSQTQVQQASTSTGGVARGALAGAATGAIIGDRSKYAKRRAAVGAVAGGARQKSQA